MIAPLTLSLLLAQTPATIPQGIGAVNTITAAWLDRDNRAKSFNGDRTRVCVGPASGKTLTGRTTLRFGVLLLTEAAQTALTMPSPSGEAYAAAEVQIDPDLPDDRLLVSIHTLNAVFDVVREEIEVRASPLVATAEVCFVRRDAPEISTSALFRCACAATPATCTWTRTNGDGSTTNVTPAPTGFTFAPGTFSGAGCLRKPCFTRFDGVGVDNSWPAGCPK